MAGSVNTNDLLAAVPHWAFMAALFLLKQLWKVMWPRFRGHLKKTFKTCGKTLRKWWRSQ